ncbi:MAG: hypothetical protein ACPF8V_12325, partial [Luteibaculum sp.]
DINGVRNWAFGFEFESDDCTDNNATPVTYTGSQLMTYVANPNNDATLLKMDQKPNPPGGLFYAGWDRRDINPSSAIVFHHPSGDIKKFSKDDGGITQSPYLDVPDRFNTWKVQWDLGTTEQGSSGSALMNAQGRIIGTLTGGKASCSNTTENDYFAAIKEVFDYTPLDSSSSYAPWLDPSISNVQVLDGYDPNGTKPNIDLSIRGIYGMPAVVCGGNISPRIDIFNAGSSNASNVVLRIIDLSTNSQIAEANLANLASNSNQVLSFANLSVSGNKTYRVVVSSSGTDGRPFNNQAEVQVNSINGDVYSLEITLDDYGSENRWEILDKNNKAVAAEGPYQNNLKGTSINRQIC